MPYVLLIQPKESPAGRQVVVHHVKYFAIHTTLQPSQNDSIRAVIDVRERNSVGATQVQEEPERADPHPVCNGFIAGTINITGSGNDIWNSMLLTILGDDFILLHLCEGVGVSTLFRMRLDGTRLIQEPASRRLSAGVHRKRTDVHPALDGTMSHARR